MRRIIHQYLDLHLAGALTCTIDPVRRELHRTGNQGVQHPLHAVEVRAGIDQRPQQHVAGHPSRGVDVGQARG